MPVLQGIILIYREPVGVRDYFCEMNKIAKDCTSGLSSTVFDFITYAMMRDYDSYGPETLSRSWLPHLEAGAMRVLFSVL